MSELLVDIDSAALADAALALGTRTASDTVNAALRAAALRLRRARALERLGEMADRGDFDTYLTDGTSRGPRADPAVGPAGVKGCARGAGSEW
ncbi:type II toxin-antitoxin system VapB family antitoxin [Streptomyces sp. PT12]|uniref:type II toxin-antitoxin system VapB family antitoxin n=1 Tax=Streptomyces sp. PT12 TaxID=1510197 RepID=UPI00215CFE02|nr:type II toxin-antitoxin system VapB family antitoxin [Streptomyces sp. PT12]